MLNNTFKKLVLVAFIFTAFCSSAFAKLSEKETVNIAVKALAEKLQTDLVTERIDLRLDKVSSRNLSKSSAIVKGDAFANNMPIHFDVKVNLSKSLVDEVRYDFLANENVEAEISQADMQVTLTEALLKKLGADYKTENIVAAPDNFTPSKANGKTSFKGTGEVRLGDLDWKKIEFEIVGDEKGQKISEIKYKVQ